MDTQVQPGYFNTPSCGIPTPGCAEALRSWVDEWASGEFDYQLWEQSMMSCRELVAGELGCAAGDVGCLSSITTAVADQTRSSIRDGVLLAHRMEFRSLLLPAMAVAGEDRVRWVSGPYTTQTYLDALDSEVSLIVVSSVASHDGARPDLQGLSAAAAETGTQIIVDATQSVGLVELGVGLSRLAQVAAAGYKGLACPRGVAFAASTDRAVPAVGAPSPYGMSDGTSYGPPITPLPGMPGMTQSPAWGSWVGAERALADLFSEPLRSRQERVLGLAAALRHGARELGLVTQPSDLPSPIVTFEVPDADSWVPQLHEHGLVCAARCGRLRLGVSTRTTDHDVQVALTALDQTRRTRARKE